jgi:triacylglycerol lipase
MRVNWTRQGFDPALARFLGEAAAAAYLSGAALEKKVKGWRMQLVHFFDVLDTQAFIVENEKAMILAFRGTQSPQDWMTDADVQLVNGPAGKVHDGFQCGLNAIWRYLWNFLDIRRGKRRLWITGHSLGGALATLATAKLRLEKAYPVDGLYTFGSPRVGDENFAIAFDHNFHDQTFRFVNNNDIVPRVPFRLMNYRHVGIFRYFTPRGKLDPKAREDQLLLSRIEGRIQDLLQPGSDGIKDHSMSKYLFNLLKGMPLQGR